MTTDEDLPSSSELQVAFIAESTFGTTPTTPTLLIFRTLGITPGVSPEWSVSEEITPAADVADADLMALNFSLQVGWYLTYGAEINTILEHAVRGAFSTDELATGVLRPSLTVEVKQPGVGSTTDYSRYTGARVGSLSFAFEPRERVRCDMTLSAINETTATAAIASSTYTAANTNRPMRCSDMATITVGSLSGAVYMTNLTLTIENQIEPFYILGQQEPLATPYGQRSVSFSFDVVLTDDAMGVMTAFRAGTEMALSWDCLDAAGNTWTFELPRIGYGSVVRSQQSGNNQVPRLTASGQAKLDGSSGATLVITKTDAS